MSAVNKYPNRKQKAVQVAAPGRTQRARKAGPHGSQIDSQGNNNAAPKKHPPTRGYPTKDEQ